ncbi:MAG: hypothetical protein GX548_12065 [Lentisphaerae bacterium]|nr:hypothetical protein [Lentisphaerota bacterium]
MFSTPWKKFFHTMENSGPGFPHHGKITRIFSTPWKKVFHGVENPRPPQLRLRLEVAAQVPMSKG